MCLFLLKYKGLQFKLFVKVKTAKYIYEWMGSLRAVKMQRSILCI